MTQFNEEQWLVWIDKLSADDFVIIDNFLSEDLYWTIRHFFVSRLHDFRQAGIGNLQNHQVKRQIRGDFTYWLEKNRDTQLDQFWSLLDECIKNLNRFCFLSLSGFEFHMAHYPKGSYYKRHLDQFNNRSNRIISMVLYLNDKWQTGDCGELEIFSKDGISKAKVAPIARRAVLFKSADVPHEVHMALKSRYSVTGWLTHHPASLGHLLG